MVKLLGDRELKDIANPRLFTLNENTLLYWFQVKYLPGRKNTADFLSQYPSLRAAPDSTDKDLANEAEVIVIPAVDEITHEGRLTINGDDIEKAAVEDPMYQMLIIKVQEGDWHAKRSQEVQWLRPS